MGPHNSSCLPQKVYTLPLIGTSNGDWPVKATKYTSNGKSSSGWLIGARNRPISDRERSSKALKYSLGHILTKKFESRSGTQVGESRKDPPSWLTHGGC